VVDLNLMGPIALTHAFLGGMSERKQGGKIVTVASDAGRVGSLGETVYSGAKGGAIAFTKSLAREVARYQINVNCVCPGPTATPLLAAVPEKHQKPSCAPRRCGGSRSRRRSRMRCCFLLHRAIRVRDRADPQRERRAHARRLKRM